MISGLFRALGNSERDLNDCWLAATNPRLFHQVRNKSNIEQILLSKTCGDVDKVIRINLMSRHKHVSLRIVINLVFGAVRIFQLQVQYLYDNAQLFVTHSAVHWKVTGQSQRKRKGYALSFMSKQRKVDNLNNIISQDILSQMSVVLELNDEERKILATADSNSQTDNFCIHESVTAMSLRADLFNSDDSDDFGILNQEDIDHLLSIIPSRKRKYCEESDDDASQCTEIFRIPHAHRATTINLETVTHCSFKTPPRYQNARSSEIDILEDQFQNDILISSTPINPSHSTNRAQHSDQHYNQHKKCKRVHNYAIDKNIEINERKFVNQFEYLSTLRHIDAKNDIVSLFEMKKVNSKQLTVSPCHRIYSRTMLTRFHTGLIKRKAEVDPSIFNAISNCSTSFSLFKGLDSGIQKEKPTKRKLSHRNRSNETDNLSPSKRRKVVRSNVSQDEDQSYMVIEKVALGKPLRREQNFPNNMYDILNILNELWRRETYPVNMKTICGSNTSLRKDIALTFFTIIELKARGYVDIVKDTVTLEIIHIMKTERSRQTA